MNIVFLGVGMVLSPLVAFPFVLWNALRGKGYAIFYLCVFLALLQSLMIPQESSDIVRHTERYLWYRDLSWDEFYGYVKTNSDSLFYFISYFFSVLGFPPNACWAAITFFNVFSFVYFAKKIMGEAGAGFAFPLSVFAVFISISYPSLFSGLRFYLGLSLLLLGITFLISKKRLLSVLFFSLSVMTHFSLIAIVPFVLIAFSKLVPTKVLIAFFVVTSTLWFVPSGIVTNILSALPLDVFFNSNKIESYVLNSRVSEQEVISSRATGVLIPAIRLHFWFFFASMMLLLWKFKDDFLSRCTLAVFCLMNVVSPYFMVSGRFSSLAALMFTLFLVREYSLRGERKVVAYVTYFFLFLFVMRFMLDFIIYRQVFLDSFVGTYLTNTFSLLARWGVL